MNTRYTPGVAAAAVTPRSVVLAPADHVEALMALLDRPDPTALELLSVLSGGDVARLPAFAAVVADGDDCVVMVRGDYRVARGDLEWSGEATATWCEHRVAGGHGEDFVVSHGPASDAVRLPLLGGVVLAAEVAWSPVEGSAEVAAPAEAADPAGSEPVAVDSAAATELAEPAEPASASAGERVTDPEVTLVEANSSFDETHGATVQGTALPRTAEDDATPGPVAGDHDGRTITAADLQRLRGDQSTPTPAAVPRVHATVSISGGETVGLDRPVIIGRAPRAAQRSSHDLPHLIVVDDPYVSGTHVEVQAQGARIIAIDRSTNGTTLTRPGQPPERLAKDQPVPIGDGCVLGLSDDLKATIAIGGGGQ